MKEVEYLSPASQWAFWNCNNFENFLEKFLIKGKFHNDVPEDIRNSYEIVERMMTYSYYYYQLYDEAISKVTRIFEMSIKLRIKLLNDEFVLNKKISTLDSAIRELAKAICPNLEEELLKAKKLRNYFAHPENYSFGLASAAQGIFEQYINMINKIFKDRKFFDETDYHYSELLEKSQHFSSGLYVLQSSENYLIGNAIPFRLINYHGEDISLWGCTPVLNKFPKDLNNYISYNPFIFILNHLEISQNSITGNDVHTGNIIKFIKSSDERNMRKLKNFSRQYESSTKEVRDFHLDHTQKFFAKAMIRFEYDYYWE